MPNATLQILPSILHHDVRRRASRKEELMDEWIMASRILALPKTGYNFLPIPMPKVFAGTSLDEGIPRSNNTPF